MARPRRSPWLLAWLVVANGWSNERLAAEYLRCWDRPLDGRLDVFTSFRSMDDGRGGYSLFARDFYNSWLRYWPARLGRLVVYAEDDAKTAAVVGRLVGCLGAACAEPAVAVASYDVSRATRAPHKVAGAAAAVNANFTALDDVQMQAWEYVLDLLSEAEYLAVLDDDSCLQDVVLPRGDLAACDGRLVVRGVRFERRPGKPTKHEASNGAIGVDSDVNFIGGRGELHARRPRAIARGLLRRRHGGLGELLPRRAHGGGRRVDGVEHLPAAGGRVNSVWAAVFFRSRFCEPVRPKLPPLLCCHLISDQNQQQARQPAQAGHSSVHRLENDPRTPPPARRTA